jgi:hypothetical protein
VTCGKAQSTRVSGQGSEYTSQRSVHCVAPPVRNVRSSRHAHAHGTMGAQEQPQAASPVPAANHTTITTTGTTIPGSAPDWKRSNMKGLGRAHVDTARHPLLTTATGSLGGWASSGGAAQPQPRVWRRQLSVPHAAGTCCDAATCAPDTYIHTCYTCAPKSKPKTQCPLNFMKIASHMSVHLLAVKNSSNLPGTARRLPPRTIKGLNQCHNHHNPLPAFDCAVWAIARSTKGAAGRPQAWQELGLADTPLTQRQMHMQAHRQAYIAHELCMACTSSAAIHHMWHLSNVRAGLRCIRRKVPPIGLAPGEGGSSLGPRCHDVV